MSTTTLAIACMIALILGTLRVQAANDDCEFLREAIREVAEGGVVHIPVGTFECRRPVAIDRDDITLAGAGRGLSILKLAAGAHAPLLVVGHLQTVQDQSGNFVTGRRVTGVRVRDLSLDGNRWQQDVRKECGASECDGDSYSVRNNGLTIRGASNVIVERVASYANISGGLVTEKYCDNLLVQDFEAHDNFFDGFAGYETVNSEFRTLKLYRNRGAGISLDLNFNLNRFVDVSVFDSGDVGVFARHVHGNSFTNLKVLRSGNHGVFLAQDRSAKDCAYDNDFVSLTIRYSEKSGFRMNDRCSGNRIRSGSDLCFNIGGPISESSGGSVVLEGGIACVN